MAREAATSSLLSSAFKGQRWTLRLISDTALVAAGQSVSLFWVEFDAQKIEPKNVDVKVTSKKTLTRAVYESVVQLGNVSFRKREHRR